MARIKVSEYGSINARVLACGSVTALMDTVDEYIVAGWKLSGGVCKVSKWPRSARYEWIVTLIREPV